MLRRAVPLLAATTLGILASTGTASAGSFTVTTTNDSNDGACTASLCSLRDAIVAADTAGGSSTITVPAGTYKLTIASTGTNDPTTGDLDINNNSSVTINGAGAGSTIIDPTQIDRAFAVQQNAALSLSGVTIRNGFANTTSTPAAAHGGAIYTDGALTVNNSVLDQNNGRGGAIYADVDSSSVNVDHTILSHNFSGGGGSGEGGAIWLGGGTLTVANSVFDTDKSYDDGGAIYQSAGTVTISGSTFTNDDTGNGGAIEDLGGAMTISGSSFNGNSASSGDGGALLFTQSSGDVSITDSSFSGNSATDDVNGGAIAFETGSGVHQSVSGSTFTGNSAVNGPAIYDDGGPLTVTKTHLTRNSGEYGGGIFADTTAGTLTVDHSTFDHNSGTYESGGGLYLDNTSTTTISNTTISHNAGGDGGGIDFATTVPAQLTNDTITNNAARAAGDGGGIESPENAAGIVNTIVANNSGGDCETAAGSSVDQGHNLDSDGSCFPSGDGAAGNVTADPLLGPLQDNGGPGPTQVPQSGSPALGAASNTACPSDDERGVTRPQPAGGTCDIGAVEVTGAGLSITKTAPTSAKTDYPTTYTIKVSATGPGPSTGTTVVDQLPAGMTLFGASSSQGGCSASGTPTKVTCAVGTLNTSATGSNTSATITLLVSETHGGSVTNTATATNDQGANVSASATTKFVAPIAPQGATHPKAKTGGHSHVTKHSAKVRGHVSTGRQPTVYFFQYGRTKKLGLVTGFVRIRSSRNVSATIRHLRAGRKYFFRLVAINDSGISYGKKHSLRTKK